MAEKPSLKPINLIAGATAPPPTPSLTPPSTDGVPKPPPVKVDKAFVPVVSNYSSGASGTRPLAVSTGKQTSQGGDDGFQLSDVFSLKRLTTEAKAVGDLVRNAGPGLVTLAGGLGADLYHVVLNDFTGKGYSYETTKEFVKGGITTFTPGHYVDYWHRIQRGESITPFLVSDAANISMVGSVLGRGITAGAISAQASTEAVVAKAAAAGMSAEAIARAATKTEGRAARLADIGEVVKSVSRDLNKPMQWSFQPYIWAGKNVHASLKSGAIPVWYDFKNGSVVNWETKAWGESAANKYAEQIAQYKVDNPDATMADIDLSTLVTRYNRHSAMGRSPLKAATIRKAVRDATFDSSQTYRALMREKTSPAHLGEVNPETGEAWGELSPVEEQAIIASINGRAQLIKAMSEKSGISPEELAVLGRLDWAPELHLSPQAARLAVRFIAGDASLSPMQYSRLSQAVEGIGKSVANITNKSLAGYGRKTKMPLDYTVPTPHVVQLREALVKSGNKEALDIFDLAERSEIFDLPLNDPLRRNLIMRLVELLPEELALDPSLYPAIERENLAFFNRVRKAIDNGEVGKILGEPLPEGPFGPDEYTIPRNKGKGSKAESMLSAARQKVTKIENQILKIVEQIEKTEAIHAQKVDAVKINDMVDAYVAGASPKSLARKNRMPLSEVEKVLAKHPVSRAWREVVKTQEAMASMERAIGKKRAAMGEAEATVEVQKMQGELELRRQEAEVAQNKYDTSVQLNEVVRQLDETALEGLASDFTTLEDDLYSAELDLEMAGGNLEDIQVPLSEIPDATPMTIGRATAHINELVRRIDEVFSKEAEATSPELAADVQRVKTIFTETWARTENNFYDSPTEQLTMIAQMRVEQLGELFKSVVDNATDATSLVDQTLRSKNTLGVIDGSINPFAPREARSLYVEGSQPIRDMFWQRIYETDVPVILDSANIADSLNSLVTPEIVDVIASMDSQQRELAFRSTSNLVTTEFSIDRGSVPREVDNVTVSFNAVEGFQIDFTISTEMGNGVLNIQEVRQSIKDTRAELEQFFNDTTQTIFEGNEYFDFGSADLQIDVPRRNPKLEVNPGENHWSFATSFKKFMDEFSLMEKFIDEAFGPEGATTPSQALLSNVKSGLNSRADFAVIPCGATKLGKAAPAAEFYTGSMFKDALDTARQHFSDDKIFVVSAKHGLVSLDQVLEPYDLKLGSPGSIEWNDISVQLTDLGITGKVLSLLPKDYFRLFERSTKGVPNMPSRHNIEIENLFEGTKGIGEQKGRLKQLRTEATPVSEALPLRPADVVGAIELSPELESYAKTAAEDAQLLEDLRLERDDALMLERDIESVKNPTTESVEKYRQSQIEFYEQEVRTMRGVAETNLGANWDYGTDRVTWDLTPIKGAAEWEWWYRLDGKTRQTIARDYFSSVKLKNVGATGPRTVRKAVGIESYANDAGMTVDQFADAMMEVIDNIRQGKKNITSVKAAASESMLDEYVKLNSEELMRYEDQLSMTGDEYNAVVSRAEYLAGERPNPIEIDKLRPIADAPEKVVVDAAITATSVRNAAYEADVLEAMAKDASAKMKKAERLSDRLKAFEEYVAQSEKYRAQAKDLIEKQNKTAKARLLQVKREEKLRNLKDRKRVATNQARRITKAIEGYAASPGLAEFRALDASLPLKTALEPGYPSEQFPVEMQLEGGGVQPFELAGPMYLPTGDFGKTVGGIQREVIKEGLTGHNRSTNEHYRQGDRHTIFSIRLIADRLGKDMANMTLNEKFRSIISVWGKKVSDVLPSELLTELRARAERTAVADPYDITGKAALKGLFDEEGLAAYNAGLENPKMMYELAVAIEYGKLIHFEMETRGLDAIDPYAPMEKRIGISRINEDAMYVEKGLKENIAKQSQIFDPTKYNVAWRAMNSVTAKFKTTTLVLSASWQLGDIISTFIISGMVGVNPLDLIQRMKQVKLEEYGPGLRTMIDPTAPLPEVQGETIIAVESPTQDVDLSQQERIARQGRRPQAETQTRLSRVTRGKYDYPAMLKGRSPVKVSFKLNETINRISRHAFFLEKFEIELAARGTTIERVFADQSWRYDQTIHDLVFDVADSANKWLGDFSDLSMAERKYVTPLFPFYAWTKHIHKVFYALGTEHPQSLAWYIYLGTLNFDPNEDPMGLRAGAFNMAGGLASAGVINPLGDVAQGPLTYPLTGERSRLFSGLGPVPRLTLGLGLGFDIANFKDIERPVESYSTSPLGSRISPITNISGLAGFTAGQFPIIKRSLQVLPQGNLPIPGLRGIATGAVSTYPTGEARLSPYTGKPIEKWGGQAAAIGRLFSLPGIPYQTDKQIAEVEAAARKRLQQVQLRQMIDR